MGYSHLDILPFQVDWHIERLGGHRVFQQVEQTVARDVALAVEDYGEAGVEEGIVLYQRDDEIVAILIVAEYGAVGSEADERTVRLICRLYVTFIHYVTAAVEHTFTHPVADTGYVELCRQGVDGLDTDTVETHRLLESLGVILATGVHARRHVDELAQRDTSAEVAHGDSPVGDIYRDLLAETHHVFVDGIVEHLLDEHIDAVVIVRAIAELADIHTGTTADMLLPVECLDVVLAVTCGCLHFAVIIVVWAAAVAFGYEL